MAWPSIAMAEQFYARRQPDPPGWSDMCNGVNNLLSSGQAVCDARDVLTGLSPYHEFQLDLGVTYRGSCLAGGYRSISPFFGQVCPDGYWMRNSDAYWGCGQNVSSYGPNQVCETRFPVLDRPHDNPGMCPKAGNPIYPLTGAKRQTEHLLRLQSGESLDLVYDNRSKLPDTDAQAALALAGPPAAGRLWESTLHKRVVWQTGSGLERLQAARGAHVWTSFANTASGGYVSDTDINDRVVAANGGWRYVDAAAPAQEIYNSSGVLTTVAYARGGSLAYVYSDSSTPASVAPVAGLLIRVQDQYGRAARFEYEQPAGVSTPRLVRVIDPDNQAIQAGYDATGNLSLLTWPDAQARQYLYELSTLPWALTGIVDENNERHSTYTYDAEGRAQSTEYAGGVNRYSVSYASPPGRVTVETYDSANFVFWRDHSWQLPQDTVLTTPNGTAVNLGATLINGVPRMTSRSQPAGAGCDASTSVMVYDANGNITSKTDFNGSKSCHAHDQARNLETTRIEGLGSADACPADLGTYTIPADAPRRKITTQWHSDWSLPVRQAEPRQVTTSIYNGQPDPTAGGATASCAATSAVLPDGKPIAVLCKKVEQATTDATGSLGFGATPEGMARVSTWTYNQYGQMLTVRDPRNKLTTYAYYGDTTADHTTGDLQSVTDSNGRVAQYTRYDKSGRLLKSIDANSTVTDTTYTPRGWVKTATVTPAGAAAQLTTYDYDGVGQLKKATLPDSMVLEYAYDAAHRLTSVKDTAGNSVTYTLDNMGNRTGEDLKDPSGSLARNITRVYDALNRMQSATGTAQ